MNLLRTALVTIVEADGPAGGTMQALCGRASDLIRVQEPLADVAMPIVTYLLPDVSQGAGNGDQRGVIVQLDTWADAASGGLDKAEQLADRLELILIEPNFRALSVDAAPIIVRRHDGIELEDDVAAGRRRVTMEITFAYKRG